MVMKVIFKPTGKDRRGSSLARLLAEAGDGLNRPLRLAVVGIGQELRGDDAAGLWVARGLLAGESRRRPHKEAGEPAQLLLIEAGPVPENFTGPLRRFAPDLVLLIDAAEMGEPPGTIRCLTPEEADGFGASTHTLPLSTFSLYLQSDLNCRAAILGIQPGSNGLEESLTPEVAQAVEDLVQQLAA